MRPTACRRAFALISALVAAAALDADNPTPTPTPKRGGYGSPAAGPTPRPAAQPAPAAGTDPDWMAAAQAHLGAVIDEVGKRSAAADLKWSAFGPQADARLRELMTQAGYSGSEMTAYSPGPIVPTANEEALHRQFYSTELSILTKADLRRVANPPVFSFRPEPISKVGNRAAVEAALAALDDEMAVFRFYDGVLQTQFGAHLESDAQWGFLSAEYARSAKQAQAASKEGDPGPFDDATNTEARAKFRGLSEKEERLMDWMKDAGRDPRCALPDISLVANLRIFAGFERLVTNQDNPVARRTSPLVPLFEVARRMEKHIQELGIRSSKLYTYPAFQSWIINPSPFLGFYERQVEAIETSLHRWFERGGATAEELGRIDAQVKASEATDATFIPMIQKLANEQQQLTALEHRSADLGGEIGELLNKAVELRGNKDYAGAYAMESRADPLKQQQAQLDLTRKQIYTQNGVDVGTTRASVLAINFVTAVPPGHVIGVQFELATENEPAKSAVPEFPLKGAPVGLTLERHVTDITVGIPLRVRVDWEQDEGTAPGEQAVNLVLGGKSVALTVRPNPYHTSYYSDPVVFTLPAAAQAAPAPKP